MTTETHEIERQIVVRAIRDILGHPAGYDISVMDGEEFPLRHSTNEDAILEAMFSTDEDYLFVYPKGNERRLGWVQFIYGNGAHVISDYVDNETMNDLLAGADKLSNALETEGAR